MGTNTVVGKNKICEAIRKFRLMRHMSTKELAERTGIGANNISSIESGNRVPKLEMCNKIANSLNADPVEICGLELTEQDEKRLLMKYLTKYADKVELVKGAEGKTIATLPIDFADFAMRYAESRSAVAKSTVDIEESDPRYEIVKANAEDELMYWLDMYPIYDAVTVAKNMIVDGNYPHSVDKDIEKSRSQGVADAELVGICSDIVQEEMSPDFMTYQSEYIIPARYEARVKSN